MMKGRRYRTELFRLKELAHEFAEAVPALAPLLGEAGEDPDVERLLEGAAYSVALLRGKLDTDFPCIVKELTEALFPHYLRPFPAATVIAFSPGPSLAGFPVLPAGTRLAGVPVDGATCTFTTAWDVELHPLELAEVTVSPPTGRGPAVTFALQLSGMPLSEWRPCGLRLFLSGDYVPASDLFMVLCRHLERIVLTPESGGEAAVLPPECLQAFGLDTVQPLSPWPSHAFTGYRLLREYFTFPGRYLFLELAGWERWKDRGKGGRFTARFELDRDAFVPAHLNKESVALFAVPAVNVFAHEADPVLFDHSASSWLCRPAGHYPAHIRIHSVDSMIGTMRGTGEERSYQPFDLLGLHDLRQPFYRAVSCTSPVHAGYDVHLTVAYPPGCPFAHEEVLSVWLTCTNGALAESLRVGDITRASGELPAGVTARNITPVIPGVVPVLEPDMQRRLNTHLSLNCLTRGDAGSLRTLLELYLFPGQRGGASAVADRKRITGIESVTVSQCEKWVRGTLMQGSEIRIKVRRDHFSGLGDLYLFGCVLDRFLGMSAAPNIFTELIIEETLKGAIHQWPPRLGRQPLA